MYLTRLWSSFVLTLIPIFTLSLLITISLTVAVSLESGPIVRRLQSRCHTLLLPRDPQRTARIVDMPKAVQSWLRTPDCLGKVPTPFVIDGICRVK